MTTDFHLGLTDKDRVAASLGDSFPAGSLVLIEGPDGGGKSVWSQRLAYGFVDQGHYVSYITPELTSSEFISQMKSLSYDPVPPMLHKNLLFLHADIDTKQYLEGRGSPRHLLPRLASASQIWLADVIILDGFGSLLRHDPQSDEIMSEDEGDHLIQNFLSFLSDITSQGKLVVLTVDNNAVDETTLRPIRTNADIYLSIDIKTVGGDTRRSLSVKRYLNRDTPVDDSIGYTVQAGTGIIIENRSVA